MNPTDFGANLRRAREYREYTQEELAERVGTSGAQISHWETGRRTPNLKNLRDLSDALVVSCDSLLGRASDRPSLGGVAAEKRVGEKPRGFVKEWESEDKWRDDATSVMKDHEARLQELETREAPYDDAWHCAMTATAEDHEARIQNLEARDIPIKVRFLASEYDVGGDG